MFGLSCRHRCQCDNDALCDHVSGACTCQMGWTGTFCEKGKKISFITKPYEYVHMLLTGGLYTCVFQPVLRVSMGWIARKSVCVSTVAAAITSAEFVPVLPAGLVRSATWVSYRSTAESFKGNKCRGHASERWNHRDMDEEICGTPRTNLKSWLSGTKTCLVWELFGKTQSGHTWKSTDSVLPMLWPVSLTRHFWSAEFTKR